MIKITRHAKLYAGKEMLHITLKRGVRKSKNCKMTSFMRLLVMKTEKQMLQRSLLNTSFLMRLG